MFMQQLSLARQIDMIFREIREELAQLTSGIIFVHIRNNVIGKFGIRHDPIAMKDGQLSGDARGLTEVHIAHLRQLGLQSLQFKKRWTHGEILYEFALKQNKLFASVQFESSYNLASLVSEQLQSNYR